MNATTLPDEITRYLDRVRAALADLPADVREELLEDLPDHLREVLAEGIESLEGRLGVPERYADELRAAAGMAAAPTQGRAPTAAARKVRAGLGRLDSAVGPVLGYGRASELLRMLRPGWWVLRGYLAGLLILDAYFGGARWLPIYDSPTLAWLIVVGVCVAVSVRLGQATPRLGDWWRFGVHAGGLVLLILAAASLDPSQQRFDSAPPAGDSYVQVYDSSLWVTDVYPYDQNGRPLSGVRLLDQNGNPIRLGDPSLCFDKTVPLRAKDRFTSYPLCPPDGWGPSVTPEPTTTPGPTPSPTTAPAPTTSPTR